MNDPHLAHLADTLIGWSTAVRPGEKILIEAIDTPPAMTCRLVRAARAAGAHPLVLLKDTMVDRALRLEASGEQMRRQGEVKALAMKSVDAYIGIRGQRNITELSDIPDEAQRHYLEHVWKKVHLRIRCSDTRWVVLRWPHPSMAQQAGMSTKAFEDFFFDVCTLDYGKLARAMKPLGRRMEAAREVRITGPGTDLRFSLEGMGAVCCEGRNNIPDGEVAAAPVQDNVEGVVQYNAPTISDNGVVHENVQLRLEKGRIVAASSSNSVHLNRVLDRDAGHASSESLPWVSIRGSPGRCSTPSSTRRSPCRSTSRPATRWPN
jgi:aminopeptidase